MVSAESERKSVEVNTTLGNTFGTDYCAAISTTPPHLLNTRIETVEYRNGGDEFLPE